MDGEGFRPEDYETETPSGFLARCAGHFLNDLEQDSEEGWEAVAVLFGVLQRDPDGQYSVRWRSYPDVDDAARLGLLVAQHAAEEAERGRSSGDRARANTRKIRRARWAGLLKIREVARP